MSARLWAACVLVAVGYVTVGTVRHWRRERALTERCRAAEQVNAGELVRRIAAAHEAHKTHRAPLRKGPDGIWGCPQCDP